MVRKTMEQRLTTLLHHHQRGRLTNVRALLDPDKSVVDDVEDSSRAMCYVVFRET